MKRCCKWEPTITATLKAFSRCVGFYLRSPLTLVAGVGGSDLAARIERIVKGPRPRPVSVPARLLLASVLALTIGAPLVVGAVSAQRGPI